MPRLFIGIFLPDELKEPIAEVQSSLEKMPMRAKMIEPENLHLTITFLGNVGDEKISEISQKLDDICKNFKKFTAKIEGVMLVPSENYIRVIALDVKSNNDQLEELRKEIVKQVGGDSHPVHLTIARVREVENKNFLRDNVKSVGLERFFEIGSACLIKSVIKKTGPKYEIIHESKLI